MKTSVQIVLFLCISGGLFLFYLTWTDSGQLSRESHRLLPSGEKSSRKIVKSLPKVVIILAYMHTGSSYTGSLLQEYPGTFYRYEWLRTLQSFGRLGRTVTFLNGSTLSLSGQYVDHNIASEAVINMLTCQHQLLDVNTLTMLYDSTENRRMWSARDYYNCLRQHQRLNSNVPNPLEKRVRLCLHLLKDPCINSTVRAFKFIRMRMSVAEAVLERFPNVKIVHLLRDPRAMLDSQVRKADIGSNIFRNFVQNTKDFCHHMLEDLDLADQLNHRYPKNMMRLRYEDLAGKPLSMAQALYQFIGIQFNEKVKQYVNDQARYQKEKNFHLGRKWWRTHISQAHLEVVDTHCSDLYKRLGYHKYENVLDIRDIRKPTYLDN